MRFFIGLQIVLLIIIPLFVVGMWIAWPDESMNLPGTGMMLGFEIMTFANLMRARAIQKRRDKP